MTSCSLLTRTRLAVTGQSDESWNSTEAKMATFDQLVFDVAEQKLVVPFLDFVFSNKTTDVFCLICIYSFFIYFCLNVHPDTFKGPV